MSDDSKDFRRLNPGFVIPPHFGNPPNGIGCLSVTITYESIDREQVHSDSLYFRVRKGPLMPMRSIIRSKVLRALDSIADTIEQLEVANDDESPGN